MRFNKPQIYHHQCPDTTDAASMVIKTLSGCLFIIVGGMVASNLIRNVPFPEWFKEVVMAIVIGLVGLLAQAKRSDNASGNPTAVEVVNSTSDPVQTQNVNDPVSETK